MKSLLVLGCAGGLALVIARILPYVRDPLVSGPLLLSALIVASCRAVEPWAR